MKKQPNSFWCFICGVKNVGGVQVAFYETANADGRPEVLSRFIGRSSHQGYPGRMHGGVVTGILDETIGRAINAGEDSPTIWGVATELSVRFRQPVPLDVELTARGRITRDTRRLFEGNGELCLPDGTAAATAIGKYLKQPLADISDVDPDALGWRVYDE